MSTFLHYCPWLGYALIFAMAVVQVKKLVESDDRASRDMALAGAVVTTAILLLLFPAMP